MTRKVLKKATVRLLNSTPLELLLITLEICLFTHRQSVGDEIISITLLYRISRSAQQVESRTAVSQRGSPVEWRLYSITYVLFLQTQEIKQQAVLLYPPTAIPPFVRGRNE